MGNNIPISLKQSVCLCNQFHHRIELPNISTYNQRKIEEMAVFHQKKYWSSCS